MFNQLKLGKMRNPINVSKPTPQVTAYLPDISMAEWDAVPNIKYDNPMSFGKDFNLIRAVAEYGPSRVDEIEEEMEDLRKRMIHLTDERNTLTRLIDALNTP
jgi:hypothetical protein